MKFSSHVVGVYEVIKEPIDANENTFHMQV